MVLTSCQTWRQKTDFARTTITSKLSEAKYPNIRMCNKVQTCGLTAPWARCGKQDEALLTLGNNNVVSSPRGKKSKDFALDLQILFIWNCQNVYMRHAQQAMSSRSSTQGDFPRRAVPRPPWGFTQNCPFFISPRTPFPPCLYSSSPIGWLPLWPQRDL